MIIYISGPMTGMPDHNYDFFDDVAADFRRLGFEVINPAENFGGATDLPRDVYMRRDFSSLARAHGIVMLPGWQESEGARLEAMVAQELGMAFFEPNGDPLDADAVFEVGIEIRRGKATLRFAAPGTNR